MPRGYVIQRSTIAGLLAPAAGRRSKMPEISLADRAGTAGDASRSSDRDVTGPIASRGSAASIGARLRATRKKRRLTLQDASKLTGVSASAFSKIERDDLSPTIST